MKSGGTINVGRYNGDQNAITTGDYPVAHLVGLPLLNDLTTGSPGSKQGYVDAFLTGKDDPTNIGAWTISTIPLPGAGNTLSLVSHAFDETGNYRVATPNPHIDAYQSYGFGFARVNGRGAWIPMGLMPSLWADPDTPDNWWAGGFGSIAGAIQKLEWIGFKKNAPGYGLPPVAEMLALWTINTNLAGPVDGQVTASAYAFPNANR